MITLRVGHKMLAEVLHFEAAQGVQNGVILSFEIV